MLDGFPRSQHSKAVEAPRTQAREVLVSFGNRKRTPEEGDLAMVGKIRGKISAAVRIRNFAIAAQIDAAQNDPSPVFVNEPSSFNMQSWQVHCASLTQCPSARQAARSDGGELAGERDNSGAVRRRFAGRTTFRRDDYQRAAGYAGGRTAARDPDAVPCARGRDAGPNGGVDRRRARARASCAGALRGRMRARAAGGRVVSENQA